MITAAVALAVTGGFAVNVSGVRVSARSPAAAVLAAGVALSLWCATALRAGSVAADLRQLDRVLVRRAPAIVCVVACLAVAVAIWFASFSASGADGSGYLSEAKMLAGGSLARPEPLAASADWANAAHTVAPLGWRPALEPGLQVPTYPAGLPLLMAPFHAVGGTVAACLVVPLSFGVAIWATGALAQAVAGPAAAVLAAVWMATSPVALIGSMQPMTDVPVTAAWLLCWLVVIGRRPAGDARSAGAADRPAPLGAASLCAAGVCAAAAVLIRPNLGPLAAIPAAYLLCSRGTTFARIALFAAPVAAAAMAIAYLQWRWFGSPLRSGHGTAAELYVVANAAPNAVLYTRWLIDTHGPWLLVAPLAMWLPMRRASRWLLLFAALVCAAYFVFAVFEVWTYLRFLLPALAIAMIATAAVVAALVGRLPAVARAPAWIGLMLAIAALNISSARAHDVFGIAAVQARAKLVGRHLAAIVPAHAVIISGEQSGAMRYYTERSIVRWDVAAPEAMAGITGRLARDGRDTWIVLDDWEEELFRRKFTGWPDSALDWPPRVDAGSEPRTRAWQLADRARFLRGEATSSERLRDQGR